MMLSRTALNLYWIGRYMERAEFTTQLVEATIRLSSLSGDIKGDEAAWQSALSVVSGGGAMLDEAEHLRPFNVSRYLMLDEDNANSVRECLFTARDNARAVRNALTREVWESINRAWLDIRDRSSPGGLQATVNLIDNLKASARGFEGALSRMLRQEAYWFMRLGSVIERCDNTARLLDVKYYLILPEGEQIGGTLDRDQWTAILQTVSARNAYRALYRQGLRPWHVADMLIFRREFPRSLTASATETVDLLAALGDQTGRQGEADRLARQRQRSFENNNIGSFFQAGLHGSLQNCIAENAAIDQAIAQQFRFG